jgi:hypothetical protein
LTAGALVVIAVRLLVPLIIFRAPLIGGIASMVVDALDVVAISVMQIGGFEGHYHSTDKVLDSYYLAIEWIVALRWDNAFARWPAAILFPYRMIGVALFELTDQRIMLFLFPNLFENWWLYVLIVAQFFPRLTPRSLRSTVTPLALLLVPKMAQEYVLHFAEAQPWDWMKRNVF